MDNNTENQPIDVRAILWQRFSRDMLTADAVHNTQEALGVHAPAIKEAFAQTATTASDALKAVQDFGQTLDVLTLDLVRKARADGDSWQKIGDALDMTKQAAHEKYAHRI